MFRRKLLKYTQLLAILPISLFSFVGPIADSNPALGSIMAQHEMPLTDRWPDKFVNQVFADNILLNLAYMRDGHIDKRSPGSSGIDWNKIEKPFQFEFRLDPNQTFAFHDDVLPKYQGKVVKTSNAHFTGEDGFKTDGYLFGDGVCHLASLLYWVAKDAGLDAEAPTNHNFANITDIPKEYGVAIYSNPATRGSNAMQNLYITNNKEKPITFKIAYADNKVKVAVVENN